MTNKIIKKEIRCNCCQRKLAEGDYQHLLIKCPRCKTFNSFQAS